MVFSTENYIDVLTKSKLEAKPVVYMFYATWCSHCNKMKKDLLPDPTVVEFLKKNFVCVWQDVEKDEGPALSKKYGVRAYPTFAVIDNSGELLYSFSGEFQSETFIKELEYSLDSSKQFPYLKKQFYADTTNGDKCYAYVAALRKSGRDASEPATVYLSQLSESQLVSSLNWKIIANGVRDISSREFQYVLHNQEAFANVASPIRVERKILNIVSESLQPYADALDTLNYKKFRIAAKNVQLKKTDSLVFKYDRTIYERSKNWKSYDQSVAESVKLVWESPSELNDIADVYLKNITAKPALDKAIQMATRSSELKESKTTYLLLAKLELKVGNKKASQNWAQKAKALALSYGWETNEEDEILKQI